MTTIEIYPKCAKPRWLKKGTKVWCLGEAQDTFKTHQVGKNAAFLLRLDGSPHGWESFAKLSKPNLKRGY